MFVPARHTQFLASVRNEAEASLAVSGGAAIVDCKEPHAGALGALPVATVAAIRRSLPLHIPVSATVGDLPCAPATLTAAARAMASAGVEFVKIGFFPGGDAHTAAAALGSIDLAASRLVAVLFADLAPDFTLMATLARARFAGVMLDTAGKESGGLRTHMTDTALAEFIARARHAGLFVGLAGSLKACDVAPLLALRPDVLGFRGALCDGTRRTQRLHPRAVRTIASLFDAGVVAPAGPRATHDEALPL